MPRIIVALMLLTACMVGCGSDADLIASGKIHVENIKKVQAQLKENPDDEELKKELRSHCMYFDAIIKSAGDAKNAKSNLEDKIFKGMDEAERKELTELIYKSK